MTEQTIIEWITDSNTCFLIGSGCSLCAKKPLMPDLTKKVIAKLNKESKDLFNELEDSKGRKPTIEDFLNQLIQINKILLSRKDKQYGDWDDSKINAALKKTLLEIVNQMGGEWEPSQIHERFFKRIAHHKGRKLCDIFSLNYDVVFETTFEDQCLPYVDGFRGADNAYFDPSLYKMDVSDAPLFRLYKLHGSINWVRDHNEVVRRIPHNQLVKGEKQVIYPSEQKYYQTQYGIYETLLSIFRNRLREDRPNNKLVVLGYSLSDDHINEAIIDAICEPNNNLTVYVFLGVANDFDEQIKRLRSLVERSNNRFNVMVGDKEFLGPALEKTEWESLKSSNLWKFENLVDILTKGKK